MRCYHDNAVKFISDKKITYEGNLIKLIVLFIKLYVCDTDDYQIVTSNFKYSEFTVVLVNGHHDKKE